MNKNNIEPGAETSEHALSKHITNLIVAILAITAVLGYVSGDIVTALTPLIGMAVVSLAGIAVTFTSARTSRKNSADKSKLPLLIACLAVVILASGCSTSKINERYGTDGALVSRDWKTSQVGTTRQASMSMNQSGGDYLIESGEQVSVDPEITNALKTLAAAGITISGLPQFRRAGALAPVSVNSLGSNGITAQPINDQQAQVLQAIQEMKTVINNQATVIKSQGDELAALKEASNVEK